MVLPYFILLIVCVSIVYTRVYKFGRISLVDWSILFIGLVYGFFSIFIIDHGSDVGFFTEAMGEDYVLSWAHVTALLILIISILIGWESSRKLLRNQIALSYISEGRIENLAWVLLFIAILFQYFYSKAYGGFIGMLEFSTFIRSGTFDEIGISNRFSFLQPFATLAYFSSFIFFSFLLSKSRSIFLYIGFVLSFVFSIYVLYSLYSRLAYVIYFAVFCIFFLYYKRLSPLKIVTLSLFLPVLGLGIVYMIALYLGVKVDENSTFSDFIAKQISFTFASFYSHAESGYLNPGLYMELMFSPLYLLPSSLGLVFFDQASVINTIAIIGSKKGEAGNTSTIPVDLITLGFLQGRWLGVIFIGFLFGVVLKVLEYVVQKVSSGQLQILLISYLVVKFSINAVFYASPTQFIIGNFSFFLLLMILFFMNLKFKIR